MYKSNLIKVFFNDRDSASSIAKSEDDIRAEELASFLSGGIQGNLERTRKLLNELTKVENGEREEYGFNGNDMVLFMRPHGAQIENDNVPGSPVYDYTLEEIRDALDDWVELLMQPAKNQQTQKNV